MPERTSGGCSWTCSSILQKEKTREAQETIYNNRRGSAQTSFSSAQSDCEEVLIWDLVISKLSDSLQEDVIHVQGEEFLPAFLIKLP